jgi:predicted phosphoribosyltransferase
MDFITAIESIRCSRCDRIAVATPTAPTIIAISPTRLKNTVE